MRRFPGSRRIMRALSPPPSEVDERLSEVDQQLADFDARLADVRDHLTRLYQHHLEVNHQVHLLEEGWPDLTDKIATVEAHMPAVLNAIASSYGTARLLRREIESSREDTIERLAQQDEVLDRLSGQIRDELWPLMQRVDGIDSHTPTIEYLLRRVETVRAEMLHELRYGADRSHDSVVTEIVNESAWQDAKKNGIRLNLGCGHLPVDGYINVDSRRLPGVDIVAAVDQLPVGPDSVVEIFSSHMLEHFPLASLTRQLLPYWFSILAPEGTLRAIVPDHDAMVEQYGRGEISFVTLREVTYGGQEYEGDFHFNAFTPESLQELLVSAGFDEVTLIERARRNGDCLEFEMSARRPA